jgi:hypothetical protein
MEQKWNSYGQIGKVRALLYSSGGEGCDFLFHIVVVMMYTKQNLILFTSGKNSF